MDWNGTWETIVNFFRSNGWKIFAFFATLILGIVVVKLLVNVTRRVLNKTKMEKIAVQFLVGVIKVLLYLILVLILLSIAGVQITGIITALSAALLAVGMALENNIANLANGIVIVSTKMFKKGDYISVDGVEGSIININFLFTTLITPDNKKITIPNSAIVNNSVTNVSANSTRRVDFTFAVAYESDTELVKKIVIDVMRSDGRVYEDDTHTLFCKLKTLNSSSIDFFANCWCDKEDYWDVYYYIIENVYNEFKKYGVSIPYNQVEVRNRTDKVVMPFNEKPLQARVIKKRNKKEIFDLETADFAEIIKHRRKNKKQKNLEIKTKTDETKVTVKVHQDDKNLTDESNEK
ncbi:MAG: mechanosensitive ion channel [Clostridia bacterium]|nr:mechanosensitive ion channel [Clostridia bacterium]